MIKQVFFKQFNLAQVNKVKWFQILLCITNNSIKHESFIYTQLKDQTVLFQTTQFSRSHLFAFSLNVKQFFWAIDRTQSGATTPDQSRSGYKGNERVLHILQSSSITGTSLSDCLVSYSLGRGVTSLQRCSLCILQPQLTWLERIKYIYIYLLYHWYWELFMYKYDKL